MKTTLRLIALASVSVVALAGCVKVDMNLTLTEDDTVSGDYVVAVSKELSEIVSEEDLNSSLGQDLIEGATAEPYEDDVFVGTRTTFDEVALDEVRDGTVDIVRDGDDYVVTGSTAELTSLVDNQEVPDNAQATLSVTFPGDVSEHNGELDGTTVTWNLLDPPAQIEARGAASASSGIPLWIILVVFVVLGIGVGVAVVLVSSTKRKPAESETSMAAEYEAGILTHDTSADPIEENAVVEDAVIEDAVGIDAAPAEAPEADATGDVNEEPREK